MKKIILLSFLAFTGSLFSQDETDKKIQAGISISTGLNLNKTATKRMSTNGVGNATSFGLALNYNISNTIAFASGIDIDFETNKIKPSGEVGSSYYQYNDTKIELKKNTKPGFPVYHWTERKQKPVYLTVPTMMLFRTKYFGDFRYFGKFGLRTSFLLGNKINDNGFTVASDSTGTEVAAENNTMKAARDMNFIRANAGLALGAEWNFSGSTSLCVEMGYYYGFTPIYASNKADNMTLYFNDPTNNNAANYYSNDMTQGQLKLKVTVLF